MSFRQHGDSKNYEVVSVGHKIGYTVTNGDLKLFKWFLKQYRPDTVAAKQDIAKYDDCDYTGMGMLKVKQVDPDYIWVDQTGNVINTKEKMSEILPDWNKYDSDRLDELMNNLGFYKIYDCGYNIFAWRSKGGIS